MAGFAAAVVRPRRVAAAGIEASRGVLPAPDDPREWPAFRDALVRWREDTRAAIRYNGSLYARDDLRWTASCYSCCFLMMCDEAFYDPIAGRFTVESFLDGGERDFGGFDAVVLWHAYPRIGIDPRNQYDFYRDMPGGLAGLRSLSDRFHARGVKVFLNYNPWDTGTRRERAADVDVLCELVREIDADGIFLDTLKEGDREFRSRLDAARRGVALESELALPVERIADHHLSWAQWFDDSRTPGVLRNKWIERRHMQRQIRRWNDDHAAELQAAWMNGSGILVWENVFGSFVGWNARDRSTLKSMLPVQRRYAPLFSGEAWTPLVAAEMPGAFASLWEGRGLRLWTLVNRTDRAIEGPLLRIGAAPGERAWDLIAGREAASTRDGAHLILTGTIPASGIGGFVCGPAEALGRDFEAFLAAQGRPHSAASRDAAPPLRQTRLKAVPRAPIRGLPEEMVRVPAARLALTTEFRTRECGFYESRNELVRERGLALNKPRRITREVDLEAFAIDRTPVTNAEFARFLKASGYRPRHPENFLKHWSDGEPPAAALNHPVTYVDLDDARAYARWARKRLPREEEWQIAAQGSDGRRYPWGNEFRPGFANGGESGGTTPVKAYPEGRSPFGCYDMCGNVWEWTESERADGRTRFAIVRGGSFYKAEGSHWYMDGGPQPCDFAAKFLLMWPGLDRCATIGFRCAAGLAPAA
ncbi:MAG: SUMF1/EgtB/PvdO family nonheme iron enzyme [Bryobacteraceae bacterium]|nr:SUMF1/EgtB/PvdO family nonheme iron enzyme [Bryobacteraceae bacterium]